MDVRAIARFGMRKGRGPHGKSHLISCLPSPRLRIPQHLLELRSPERIPSTKKVPKLENLHV
eukprot:4052368-Pyramimonas_sp.AAC.1